jgi:hypothetical protein
MSKERKRHSAEEVVKKLRDVDTMLAVRKSVAAMLRKHLTNYSFSKAAGCGCKFWHSC